jgi:hypothetical protein
VPPPPDPLYLQQQLSFQGQPPGFIPQQFQRPYQPPIFYPPRPEIQTLQIPQVKIEHGVPLMQDAMHDEFSDEENQAQIPGESNFDYYDHELDNMELTKDELRKMNDTKYTYDFSRFPRVFRSVHEALDTYCALGYPNKL